MSRAGRALAIALLTALPAAVDAQGIPELHEAISGLGMPMRVLVIAAHPDDEDTQLITWLARGRHVETAYLSLTRGDGGQNLIGNELGEALGVIRTEELLAARRIDGGRQYFTRAYDFGFSKSADETFRHWPKDSILRDVVTVVRSFRPHVIVSMFSGTPRDGHGHHQAAGILAREAYDIAGDSTRLPAAATMGQPAWTPLKFYRGAWAARDQPDVLRINVGAFDPMLGRSYAEIAAQSRSQHKSQAFGSLERRGARFTQLRREATRVNEGTPAGAERSLFEGIDTTWARYETPRTPRWMVERIDSIQAQIARAQAAPYLRDPSAAVEPLMAILRSIDGRSSGNMAAHIALDPRTGRPIGFEGDRDLALAILRERTARALAIATGVAVEAEVARALVGTGDSAAVTLTVYNRGRNPVRAAPAFFAFTCGGDGPVGAGGGDGGATGRALAGGDSGAVILPDSARTWKGWACASSEPVADGPWWLETPRTGDMFAHASLVRPEGEVTAGPAARVVVLPGGGPVSRDSAANGFGVVAPIVHRFADPIRGDVSRPLAYVPELSVTLDRTIEYARARAPIVKQLRVEVRSAATTPRDVSVSLRLPPGLRADSASRTVTLPSHGSVRSAMFTVRGELTPGRHEIAAVAESNGKRFTSGYTTIEYEHIRPQRLYRDASLAIEAVDVAIPPDAVIAYIQGVGDNSAAALQQLGLRVSNLTAEEIPRTDLSRFTAIVVGTRAYESNETLRANNAALLDYVQRGGTMVVQYGQYEMTAPGIMPYPITLARPADRVTDEESTVRILDPKARVLNAPNAITARDFEGWIQDRSLYMPRTHAPEYAPVIAIADPGAEPNDGGILVASYGAGTYVYTTLAFFRQLPNGVPGAARLFVNLLAAKDPDRRAVP